MTVSPYGPNTSAIRRFLVRLAGLGVHDRARVVHAWESADTRALALAEQALATAVMRSDREGARDALTGPLLQLVRRHDASAPITTDDDALAALDPVAEPALAALMALLVRDLLDDTTFAALYAPFDTLVPLTVLDGRD